MVKILAVDDDSHLLETLVRQLSSGTDFDVTGAETIAQAKDRLQEIEPDLILLDVSLPDGDGRDACRWIRGKGYTIPILMLTAQDGELDTIEGLEAGANDYIAKPLRLGELIARIRLHLDQYQARADARITIGAFVFSAGSKTLTHRETAKDLSLTEKETAIIKYLLKREGAEVGKVELLENVWGYNERITTHTLETHIYRLRQKIHLIDESPFLLTRNKGYCLSL
ncbi:response regulator transcription factor [Alphaproteobacteria bacterium LSUCC0684]